MLKFLKNQKKEQENYANPSKRFLAYSIDQFILLVIRYAIAMAMLYLWYAKSFTLFANDYMAELQMGKYDPKSLKDIFSFFITHSILYETIFIIIIIFLLGSFYWIYMPLTKWHATFGKALFGLEITTSDNKYLNLKQATYRYFVGLIPWCFHIIVVISIFNRNLLMLAISILIVTFWYETNILKRTYLAVHDLICNTKVVNVKKRTKKKAKK